MIDRRNLVLERGNCVSLLQTFLAFRCMQQRVRGQEQQLQDEQ